MPSRHCLPAASGDPGVFACVAPGSTPFRTIAQAAAWSLASKSAIYRDIRSGKLRARKHGGKTVIHVKDLEAWSQGGEIVPRVQSISAFQRARERVRSLKTRHTDEAPATKGVG